MSKTTRFALTMLVVLAMAAISFARPANTVVSSAKHQFGTVEPMDGTVAPATDNELDDFTTVFDFEVADLSDWTWGNPRLQPSHWAADTYAPHGGSNSWRAFDPSLGDNGGYLSTWYQRAEIPAMDLTATTNPQLSFWFKLECEPAGGEPTGFDGWDGANFWISYTDGDGNTVTEVATGFTGPEYDSQSMFSFGFEWFMGTGIAGWGGSHDWSQVTLDLSDYTAYDDVKVIFAFASDPGYDTSDDPTYSGYQIDDIVVSDDNGTIFSDDAEDPDNTPLTFVGGLETTVASEFNLLDGQSDAPSPTHVLDLDNQTHGYEHYLESPEFDLPTVEDGQSLTFDIMVNADMSYADTDTYYASWTLQIWDPEQEVWWNVNNIRDINENSSYVGATGGWSSVTTDFNSAVWDGTALAGLTGVKARLIFTSPNGAYDFSFLDWDNFGYDVFGVQHDIATQIVEVPYPVTVGLPVPGTVQYTNMGANNESFYDFWGINSANLPGVPGPQIDLDAGATATMTIDTPGDDMTGWVPTSAQANGDVDVIARSSLIGQTDEDPSNDYDTLNVYVNQEGTYEFGYDAWNPYWVLTYNATGSGPMEHFVINQTNPYFDDHGVDVGMAAVYWYASSAVRDNWPADGVPLTIHVLAGGDTPGAELFSETQNITIAGGNAGWAVVDLSGVEELQGLSGDADFYVWVELAGTVSDGTSDVVQPSILVDFNDSGDVYPDNNLFYDGETAQQLGYASFIHVLATPAESAVDQPVETAVPGKFALHTAYPNPFNPTTTLRYDVARTGKVSLTVYNVMGQQVASLVNGTVQAGAHQITFDGASLSSGVYFVRMQADGFNAVRKVMLMK